VSHTSKERWNNRLIQHSTAWASQSKLCRKGGRFGKEGHKSKQKKIKE
jgi:hypothetical protein